MKFGFWCSEKVNIRPFKVFSYGLYCFVFLLPFGVTGVKKYLKLCFFFLYGEEALSTIIWKLTLRSDKMSICKFHLQIQGHSAIYSFDKTSSFLL